MNHHTAFQPPHLHGRWQYALLSERGGGPVCGCAWDDGHETREAAERHAYGTTVAHIYVHQWDDPNERRQCFCGEWTNHRVSFRGHPYHIEAIRPVCLAHATPFFDDATRPAAVEQMFPFRPGLESWSS